MMLDVGCGSNSPSKAKKWFPKVVYHGIDMQVYQNDAHDFKLMDKYFELDLSKDSLDEITDNQYDVVICSHVLEHIPNGHEVVVALAKKLKKGGKIYLEYPGEKSLNLPSMKGSLHFCDDETHVKVYSFRELSNLLLENNFKIIAAGTRREWHRILLFPLILIDTLLRKQVGGAFWDVFGFAEFVYAEKK